VSEPAFLFLGSECPRLVTQPRSRKIRVIHLHKVDDEVRGGGGEVNALAVGESAQSREEQNRKWFESTVWSDGARFLIAKGIGARPVNFGRSLARQWPDRTETSVDGEKKRSQSDPQMPGVNYAQSEPRYSASNWYTDMALMGIQSTAQFVDKYHHVIGKRL